MYIENNDFEGFKRKVIGAVKAYYGEEYEVSVMEVVKLNGVILHGLNIMERNMNICPTIYLEDYFDRYRDGEIFSELFGEIISLYEDCKAPVFGGIDTFTDYEMIKGKLSIKLINAPMNKCLLDDVPHEMVEDLALVCIVELKSDKGSNGTVLVRNNHICMWGIRKKQLIHDAIANAQLKDRLFIRKLNELVLELCEGKDEPCGFELKNDNIEDLSRNPDTMYVLSNERQINGAAVIAYPGILEKIADAIEGDYYIIPSSIHEVIILPYIISKTVSDINIMIRSINSNMLDREEILSNHAYLYSRSSKSITSLLDTVEEENAIR